MASFEYEFDFMDGSNQKTSGLLCKAPGGLSCSTIHYLAYLCSFLAAMKLRPFSVKAQAVRLQASTLSR